MNDELGNLVYDEGFAFFRGKTLSWDGDADDRVRVILDVGFVDDGYNYVVTLYVLVEGRLTHFEFSGKTFVEAGSDGLSFRDKSTLWFIKDDLPRDELVEHVSVVLDLQIGGM